MDKTPHADQHETAAMRKIGMNTIREMQAKGDTHKAAIHVGADGFSGSFETRKSWLMVAMISIPCCTFLLAIILIKLL